MHPRYLLYLITGCWLLLLPAGLAAQERNNTIRFQVHWLGKDTTAPTGLPKIPARFNTLADGVAFLQRLPNLLMSRGYAAASIDSVYTDSARLQAWVFSGPRTDSAWILTDSIDVRALDALKLQAKGNLYQPFSIYALDQLQQNLLNWYEEHGFPFAACRLDSIQWMPRSLRGILRVSQGPPYRIDSIRTIGKIRLSKRFLQQYLGIPNGSLYTKSKLEAVSGRLLQLPYLRETQPPELQMLGTGAVLNVYLEQRRSSQVNFLIGFLPANSSTNKLQLTGDINLNLKNPFGKGESILVNWQQLQVQSPRLNLGYQQPYIFGSGFGVDLAFSLFKKDSSFLQLQAQAGLQYLATPKQTGTLFIQQQSTTLLGSGVDTNLIKLTRRLPANADVRAVNVGVQYNWQATNYRFNPRSGNEADITLSAGIKNIEKNNDIVSLRDGNFNFSSLYDSIQLRSYQFRIRLQGAHYFPVGKQATVKAGIQAGWFESEQIFRNELFQIGGFKTLRGFDEEGIFATRFAVFTAEYRYLLAQNAYLFGFIDGAWVNNRYVQQNSSNRFTSAGLGLVFETRAGLLNMSFAAGRQSGIPFDFRRAAKIHFGYVSFF